MRTSIIMPVYNGEQYLKYAIDSVVRQTDPDWQLIIVDDGSTDASPAIADDYAGRDSRIEVCHVPNGGLSYARNTGIRRARGEWIAFLDADDTYHPEFLRLLHSVAESTGSDIVGCRALTGMTERFSDVEHPTITIYSAMDAIGWTLYQRHSLTCSASNKLYRASVFCDEAFTEGTWYEDLDIFYRLYSHTQMIAFIDSELYFYRQHGDSFLHKWSQGRLDVLTVVDRIEEYTNRCYPTLSPAARDRKLSANFNILLLILRTGYDAPDVITRCWNVVKAGRREALRNRRVRLKNKIGALLSYGGLPLMRLVSKFY